MIIVSGSGEPAPTSSDAANQIQHQQVSAREINSTSEQDLTGGTSSSSGRLGHRKSSLALTPEDESIDTSHILVDIKILSISITPSRSV
ncbi:unnamed protein product [Hermetia illucens]|uniref:Uncharacterized protein n=1 Tax=Hermetia illucens TaxID=343691 RepID=A0A7R8YMT6_HERIL|nr:unnamed protein product [Hermetia illucens]